ncbi:MAG: DUF2975 domain-containing protein [Gammaproteobacteria bacterium]
MEKLQRVSARFRQLFQVLFYGTPLLYGAYWYYVDRLPRNIVFHNLPLGLRAHPIHFTWVSQSFALLASILPASILMFAFYNLVALFRHYEQGNIFHEDNVRRYRRLGYALFAWVIAGLLYGAFVSFVLTAANGPGQRVIALDIGTKDITTLIVGGIIILIAWVMEEAHRLSEENAHTI